MWGLQLPKMKTSLDVYIFPATLSNQNEINTRKLLWILSGTLGDIGNQQQSAHVKVQNTFLASSPPFSPTCTHALLLCSNYTPHPHCHLMPLNVMPLPPCSCALPFLRWMASFSLFTIPLVFDLLWEACRGHPSPGVSQHILHRLSRGTTLFH